MNPTTVWLCILVATNLDLVRGQEYETTNGPVRGRRITLLGKSLDVFHGIPFAKPPVAELRFKHPQPADPWRPEVKDATKMAPSCIQLSQVVPNLAGDDLRVTPDDYSEDCLYLSIWKPSSATNGSNLAVMVWIYGGGFTIGSTRLPLYDGQYMALENDVIVVSINYRLGPLGFAYLGPKTIPGNMGLMDQVEAIKWVNDNIENFGGDKDRITLFGQSAGGFSVGYHLVSPLTKNLFNNGILQSGAPVSNNVNSLVVTASEARNTMERLSKALNCSGSSDSHVHECLKQVDPLTISIAGAKLSQIAMNFYPTVDGYYLPSKPIEIIARGEHKKTKILNGVTKDDGSLQSLRFMNINNKTYVPTGKPFNDQAFREVNPLLGILSDVGRLNALKIFYESEQSPPRDYLEILDHLGSDLFFKCPALQFSLLYAESNDVYMYSVNHRISTLVLPEWMGVAHNYELELVFGHPLNDSLGFTQEEKELSRNIMKYWTNFAKSGDPNLPVAMTTEWPLFDTQNTSFLALDVGSNLATRQGFRRHQCAFVNDILPMIPKDASSNEPGTTTTPGSICTSGSRRLYTGSLSIIVSLLTALSWTLQQ